MTAAIVAADGLTAVIDFGAGNTRSVLRALHSVGARAEMVQDATALAGAERLILPGVGAAGSAMATLRDRGLVEPIQAWVARGRPFLGICLGAQLMLETSEEGNEPGLGLVAGTCRRFPSAEQGGPLRIPHIGWNRVEVGRGPGFDAYFVHSYWLDPADERIIAGWTDVDGFRFPSVVRMGSMLGTQFHPEKSGPPGRALLQAWIRGAFDGSPALEPAVAASDANAQRVAAWS